MMRTFLVVLTLGFFFSVNAVASFELDEVLSNDTAAEQPAAQCPASDWFPVGCRSIGECPQSCADHVYCILPVQGPCTESRFGREFPCFCRRYHR